MENLRNYLNDGAAWQAQCVLAILRAGYNVNIILRPTLRKGYKGEYDKYDGDLSVGRYENCREQGYVFTIRYKGKQRNYAVYEHRNSDQLIVLISETPTLNTPSIEEMWRDKGGDASKFDYDRAYNEKDVYDCAMWIRDDMCKTLRRWTIETGNYDMYDHYEE